MTSDVYSKQTEPGGTSHRGPLCLMALLTAEMVTRSVALAYLRAIRVFEADPLLSSLRCLR